MYLRLHKRGGGIAAIPHDCKPCLSTESVGGETFTLVSVPLLDTDFEVRETVDDIIRLLGAEVVDKRPPHKRGGRSDDTVEHI